MSLKSRILVTMLLCFAFAASAQSKLTKTVVMNGDVRIETFSVGRGPLVVIVPSASRGSEDYQDFAESFAAHGFQVVCVNPRGIGGSSPIGAASQHDGGDDLAAVIHHFSAAPAVVVGHAGGSFATRVLATDRPELLRGIVLAAPGIKTPNPELGEALKKLTANDLPDDERLKLLKFAFFAPGNDASVWLRGWYPRPGGLPTSPAKSVGTGKDPRDDWWGAGHVKVLELIPEEDAFRPASTRNDYRAEFGSRVTTVTIPHAGHALFPEQPAAVEKVILAWIDSLN